MWDVKNDSQTGKGVVLWDAAHISPPPPRAPKMVGSGYVLYAVQRGSKAAPMAAENSGQNLYVQYIPGCSPPRKAQSKFHRQKDAPVRSPLGAFLLLAGPETVSLSIW